MIRLKTAVVLAPLLTLRDAGLVSNWWFLGTGVDASLEVSAGARILVQFRWDTRSEFISWRCTSWLGLEAVIHFVIVAKLIGSEIVVVLTGGAAHFRIVDGVDGNRLLDLAILVSIALAAVSAIALAAVCAVAIVGLAGSVVIVVILSRRLFRLGTVRGAFEGTAAVGRALTHLNLVVDIVALYGESHGRPFGHTLTGMDVATDRVFDGDVGHTVSRHILADVNVGQLGRVHGKLDRSSYWVLETEVDGGIESSVDSDLDVAPGAGIDGNVESTVDHAAHFNLDIALFGNVEGDVNRGVVGVGLLH